jgi:hypothetical protein
VHPPKLPLVLAGLMSLEIRGKVEDFYNFVAAMFRAGIGSTESGHTRRPSPLFQNAATIFWNAPAGSALCQTLGKTGLPTLEPIRTESATVSR